MTISFLDESMTVRELIKERIYQEVAEYNLSITQETKQPTLLITPNRDEQRLNAGSDNSRKKKPKPQPVDWLQQYDTACDAFERNGFFIVIGEKQVSDLDEVVSLTANTDVSFVKLTPLIGG
ncbi:hypothetical protein [Persicirhabdus sediminis]|nr:hypothetical protein [Persicirhabdus sediminis]